MSANEDTVRRGYEAFGQGDMATLRSIMTPDVVQSVPGESQVSGDHKGADSVLGYYGTLFELTGGTLKADLQSVSAEGADKVAAVHHLTAQRSGKSYGQNETLTFTLTGGKISRLDESHPDQAAFDSSSPNENRRRVRRRRPDGSPPSPPARRSAPRPSP